MAWYYKIHFIFKKADEHTERVYKKRSIFFFKCIHDLQLKAMAEHLIVQWHLQNLEDIKIN